MSILATTSIALSKVVLCASCYVLFSSFTVPVVEVPVCNTPIVDMSSEKDFFMDAYKFRIANRMPIPEHYYERIGIPNPNPPIVVAPPTVVETQAMKNKKMIPQWILVGILKHESRSYYDDNDDIVYIDKRIGKDGERGPFQMRRICFDQVCEKGEKFTNLSKNMNFAEELAIRYLLYLYNGKAKNDWRVAIGMYNTGPTNYNRYPRAASKYYNEVKKKGNP